MLRSHFKKLSECQLDVENNVNPLLINTSVDWYIHIEFTAEEMKSIIKKVFKKMGKCLA